jgi:hypothetical protein
MDLGMGQFTADTEQWVHERTVMDYKISVLDRETRDILLRLDAKSWHALVSAGAGAGGLEDAFGWKLAALERSRSCEMHQMVSEAGAGDS